MQISWIFLALPSKIAQGANDFPGIKKHLLSPTNTTWNLTLDGTTPLEEETFRDSFLGKQQFFRFHVFFCCSFFGGVFFFFKKCHSAAAFVKEKYNSKERNFQYIAGREGVSKCERGREEADWKEDWKEGGVGEHFFLWFLCWVPPAKNHFCDICVFVYTLSTFFFSSFWLLNISLWDFGWVDPHRVFSMGPWDHLCCQFFGDLCLAIRLRIPTKNSHLSFVGLGYRYQVVHYETLQL